MNNNSQQIENNDIHQIENNDIHQIENNDIKHNKKRFNLLCEKCNFTATRPAEWLRHVESKKHLRNGKKLDKICTICNKTIQNHFALKIHMLSVHATPEERSNHKYYCKYCDVIFLSKLYMDNHLKGKLHINKAKAIDSFNSLNTQVEQIINELNNNHI